MFRWLFYTWYFIKYHSKCSVLSAKKSMVHQQLIYDVLQNLSQLLNWSKLNRHVEKQNKFYQTLAIRSKPKIRIICRRKSIIVVIDRRNYQHKN